VPPENPSVQQARDLVRTHFRQADAAFLGGSFAAGTATPTSDLDIAVLCPAGHETFRNTTREDGRLVEWFVHTPETVDRFLEEHNRRATMAHIYGRTRPFHSHPHSSRPTHLRPRSSRAPQSHPRSSWSPRSHPCLLRLPRSHPLGLLFLRAA